MPGDNMNGKKSGQWKNDYRPGTIPNGLSGSAQSVDGFNVHYFMVELIARYNRFCLDPHFVNVDGVDRIFQDIGNRFVVVYTQTHECEYAQVRI